MKTIFSTIFCIVFAAITLSSCARRIYVSERSAPPVVVRPAPPYPGAVWIPEEYMWRGSRYEYIAPHYVRPHRGHTWVSGHWNRHRNGSVWVKGYWRR